MIIVLKGADFSANNIGRIDVERDFADFTKQVLSLYNVAVDTNNSTQKALDDFVRTLTTNDLWGTKIKHLCMPFLSELTQGGALEYAQLDAISGNNFFTANIDGSLELISHGLKPVVDGTIARISLQDISPDNIHVAGYNITIEPLTKNVNDQLVNKFIFGQLGIVLGVNKQKGGAPMVYSSSSGPWIQGDTNYAESSCLLLTCMNRADSYISLYLNGQKTERSGAAFQGVNLAPICNFGTYSYNASANKYQKPDTDVNKYCLEGSYSLLSTGELMTESEVVIYNNAVTTLMAEVAKL